ncbi:thermonuclease family protein [Sphingobium xenophagum]|uniref:thermonuclease family protein n=1 Tax=Sphingobium xenophagum TaxID=121428 RepID=UPI00031D5315|nr:thermonuclease family protein [Sphingobium xenophagum]
MILPFLLSIYQPPIMCEAIDGDTIRCSELGRVRLLGVDAPELHGCPKHRTCAPGDGPASKSALAKLIARGVIISPVTKDRYGRTVAQVYAGDRNVPCELIKQRRAIYVEKWDNGHRLAKECRSLPR